MTNELALIENSKLTVMPVMDIQLAIQRRNQMVGFVQEIMVEDTDFGTIPGTNKPTLLKPGAEKLATFFGLSKRFEIIEKTEDWTGKDHDGEPFFYYLYRCGLYRGDLLIAEADGSCNSFEAKYRYRQAQRKCPACMKATIIKGKQEYGGGWLCFKKKGGCGTKFPDGDVTIEKQEVGRILNPDVADQVNTIQKMAQKRALIAATLLAVNASEFFTQDLEDFDINVVNGTVMDGETGEVVDQPTPEPKPQPKTKQTSKPKKGSFQNDKPEIDPARPYSPGELRTRIRSYVEACKKAGKFHDPDTAEALPIKMHPFGDRTPQLLAAKIQEALGSEEAYHAVLNHFFFGVDSANELAAVEADAMFRILFNGSQEIGFKLPVLDVAKEELAKVHEMALEEGTS